MEILRIEQTKSTPGIFFDPHSGRLKIEGQSYPENAFTFYEPIFSWLDEFLNNLEGKMVLEINFHMPYINTSSSRCIMMLLEKLENAYHNGKKVSVCWFYDKENETALECAEEFREDLVLPFEIRSVEESDE